MERPFRDARPGRPFDKTQGRGRNARPRHERPPAKPHATSWEKSAGWYDRIIGERGSELYRTVVIPSALDMLRPARGERVLDLGCGQGVFSRALADAGAQVTGVDASRTLVTTARKYPSRTPVRYLERDAAHLGDLGPFDALSAILCLQNMEHLPEVCAACARVLRPGGRMVWVLNHPCFRIPRQSSWGHEEERKIQYRRLDAYASPMSIPIVMHPGKAESETTISFHRSLHDLCAAAFSAGLVLAGLRELVSDKQSEPGPRARAENRARAEFPLFLALLWERRA
ncbi:MAG: methyltransferase domain-containing protein [Verrucomicrobiaceae bacterium]|nr:methyltransferase domain-containing protein [Verrucomicrobiaceae bacterium]